MGAKYAIAANGVRPGKLKPYTRRVLMTMALRVLDIPRKKRPAGVYSWGYYRILGDMGIMPTRTSERHLKAAIAELIELHLLEQLKAGHRGQRAEYRLLLPVDNSPHKGQSTTLPDL
jgi:hypothetical protein